MQKKSFIVVLALLTLVATLIFIWNKNHSKEAAPIVNVVKPDPISKEVYPQHIETITGTDEVWYSIPEVDVRMRLNDKFATDLIYQYTHEITDSTEEWDAVSFSTKSLTDIDKGCSPKEGRPLGSMTKWKGNVQELAKTDEYFSSRLDSIIQIGDYYYMWTGPQATCWDPKKDAEIEKVRGPEVYKAIQDGFKTLQLIPSK